MIFKISFRYCVFSLRIFNNVCHSPAILVLSKKKRNNLIPVFDKKINGSLIQECALYLNKYGTDFACLENSWFCFNSKGE